MKAKIVDIEDGKVTVKTENGKFITVSEKRFKFDHRINQKITIERDGSKFYILPDTTSFWGDDEPKVKKKTNNNKKKKKEFGTLGKVLISILIACIIFLVPILINHNNIAREKDRQANLTNCLSEAISEYLKDMYPKNIACYEKYGGEDAEEKITESKKELETVEIQECVNEANENYKVTDEEISSAGTDINANLILVRRVNDRFNAEKDCYKKYGKLGDYSSELNRIEADIKESESMIKYGETEQEAANRYNESHRWLNCTTNTVGSSAYTNCY